MKLYLVEIGGMRDGSLFESHEVHCLVAASEEDLLARCEARFAGTMASAHLDGWIALDLDVDGAQASQPSSRFYVVELGRNSGDFLREQHAYRFLAAGSWKEAAQAARQAAPGWHVDAVIDLDDLALKAGYTLARDLFGEVPEPVSQSRYVRFLKDRQRA